MAFAQLTYRESLRDIEACLRAQKNKLYHMGIRTKMSRSTLADANERRDWRIYSDLAQSLISTARNLYANEDFGAVLDNTAYAFDASTIDLSLSVFPWAHFRKSKAAIKLHTLHYPEKLRHVKYHDSCTKRTFVFLTNNFTLPALTIADLHRCRWQVELFFKWIKQHLRIKAFYGTSENAVKSQIWIAISVYVLVAIIKKKLKIDDRVYTILQILSITVFEKTSLNQLFKNFNYKSQNFNKDKQLNLFG